MVKRISALASRSLTTKSEGCGGFECIRIRVCVRGFIRLCVCMCASCARVCVSCITRFLEASLCLNGACVCVSYNLYPLGFVQ